ncbi:helix-turn-helix domain-containing protein [Serinicoccus marinus]|uniref:helix-turn-helix domain-containing protein n=1 Tax=Serinicoccus marinus TaxID=247333 RepID=UPI0024920B10|nr:XRE family transcriptional regulator [Serinicoccus marinus]
MSTGIGSRVARALPSGKTQKEVATRVGMTPDAFSRALKGERGFSAVELANLAEVLDEDVHYLITGQSDPNRLVLAARHGYDPDTHQRSVNGYEEDRKVLDDIALAYRQAGHDYAESSRVPTDLDPVRQTLGADFVRVMLERLEERCGIDVVRVSALSTSYSFRVGERAVIAIPGQGNWFRENWDMAHELGHLVLGHEGVIHHEGEVDDPERKANAFAAELLLPKSEMDSIDWVGVSAGDLASKVWQWGVSTHALRTRIAALGLPLHQRVYDLLRMSTQALLRRHWRTDSQADEITLRMQAASLRHFPLWVEEAHLDRIAEGSIQKGTLAWMLGVAEDELDVETPNAPAPVSAAEVDALLG